MQVIDIPETPLTVKPNYTERPDLRSLRRSRPTSSKPARRIFGPGTRILSHREVPSFAISENSTCHHPMLAHVTGREGALPMLQAQYTLVLQGRPNRLVP